MISFYILSGNQRLLKDQQKKKHGFNNDVPLNHLHVKFGPDGSTRWTAMAQMILDRIIEHEGQNWAQQLP